jgi:hypothetical protein
MARYDRAVRNRYSQLTRLADLSPHTLRKESQNSNLSNGPWVRYAFDPMGRHSTVFRPSQMAQVMGICGENVHLAEADGGPRGLGKKAALRKGIRSLARKSFEIP